MLFITWLWLGYNFNLLLESFKFILVVVSPLHPAHPSLYTTSDSVTLWQDMLSSSQYLQLTLERPSFLSCELLPVIEVLRVLPVQCYKWSWGPNFYSLLSQLHPGEFLVALLRPKLDIRQQINTNQLPILQWQALSSAHTQIRLQWAEIESIV